MASVARMKKSFDSAGKRRNVRNGMRAEEHVLELLTEMGFGFVRKIHTGFRLCGPKGWLPVKNVAGDIRATLPPYGQSVLLESKCTLEYKLNYSMLRPHQVESLDEHHATGGLSLLAWTIGQDDLQLPIIATYIMRWPLPEDVFRKGRSLKKDEAEQLRYY